jgi:hypothetical protein
MSLRTAVGGALLAALAGCSALPGFAATPAPSPAAPAAPAGSATPARVVTIATPKPRTAPPALTNAGVAWPAILASLSGYGQWLLANPDPALAGTVAAPGCAMANFISQQATSLLADNAYLKPVPAVFGTISGPSPAPGSTAAVLGSKVTLDVTASRPAETVVSRSGKPITAFDPLPLTLLQITLYRGADNKWRFCTVDAMADAGTPDDPSVSLL